MAESNDVQAIERISAVVGESQIKIILSNQCIKAQTLLVNRLKKQFQTQKDIARFISTHNLKLEAEIQNAEEEIKSLTLAHGSIKSANVELKKEWQLAKETTQEIAERIRSGEKRYDELWLECKNRYESIQFVQNWLQAKKTAEDLTENIRGLEQEIQGLLNHIKTKQNTVAGLNKQRIIELAEYIIHERPKTMENVKQIHLEIKELNAHLENLQRTQSEPSSDMHKADFADGNQQVHADAKKTCNLKIDNDWPNLNKDCISDEMTPQLQLMSIDLEMLSVKLDQIKKSDAATTSPSKEVSQTKAAIGGTGTKPLAMDKKRVEYISCYFSESNKAEESDERNCNYSSRKLINILEDISVDKNEAYKLVSTVNLGNIRQVHNIATNANKETRPKEFDNENVDVHSEYIKNKPCVQAVVQEKEVDITSSNGENILVPPSGFLDQIRSSQENKNKVSFELVSITVQDLAAEAKRDSSKNDRDDENEANVTEPSPEVSTVNDDSFSTLKDMILKKHNLDLSPQFVYAPKTTVLQKNEEMEVTSNFFKVGNEEFKSSVLGVQYDNKQTSQTTITEVMEEDEHELDCDKPTQSHEPNRDESRDNQKHNDLKVGEGGTASVQANHEQNGGKQVSGLLFNHGAQGLPESLDVSISTTGFEDADADFPQYSSLLLSPKADLPVPSTSENCDITSQEVPNFLSGLRKTGLSFFGKIPGAESNNVDTAEVGGNNFNFMFGTDNKKNRGGFFHMFN